jgi:hypothetical protein
LEDDYEAQYPLKNIQAINDLFAQLYDQEEDAENELGDAGDDIDEGDNELDEGDAFIEDYDNEEEGTGQWTLDEAYHKFVDSKTAYERARTKLDPNYSPPDLFFYFHYNNAYDLIDDIEDLLD